MRLISDHFAQVATRLPVTFLRCRHADNARELGFAKLVVPALVVMAGTSETMVRITIEYALPGRGRTSCVAGRIIAHRHCHRAD
jgi:hypothetical protein